MFHVEHRLGNINMGGSSAATAGKGEGAFALMRSGMAGFYGNCLGEEEGHPRDPLHADPNFRNVPRGTSCAADDIALT